VRPTRLPDPRQQKLWPDWLHHCFITNRQVPLLAADVGHRRHAQIEQVIRDLKDQALAHFPFGIYDAWRRVRPNLAHWTGLIGHPNQAVETARAQRRRLLAIPGRLSRTARRWTLRLPTRWRWAADFLDALTKLRSLPRRT
jgi:hypothetical protein